MSLVARPALAQADAYKQHMENGVKLYQDKNYLAAELEFRAAYDARPNANPLVNVALCEKALFNYPKAIEALELALSRHRAVMDAADVKASEDAVREMRGLLAYLTVTVSPSHGVVVVDGDEQPAGKKIALGPGIHQVEARAEGFASQKQEVKVTSGETKEIPFALEADKGEIAVHAPDPHTAIFVDDRPRGTGTFRGYVAPGPHSVRLVKDGAPPLEVQVLVAVGKLYEVSVEAGALVVSGDGALPTGPQKDLPPPPVRGFYGLVLGSMLFPMTHPPSFPDAKVDFGAGYGVRLGFMVNKAAGFEGTYEHSSLSTGTTLTGVGDSHYRVISDRMALGLRLVSPGKVFRVVGSLSAGVVIDGLQFYPSASASERLTFAQRCSGNSKLTSKSKITNCPFEPDLTNSKLTAASPTGVSARGVDAFGLVEIMAELDVDRVLIDIGMEFEFQSTGNIATDSTNLNDAFYRGTPIVNLGPAIRIGYRFW